MDAKDLLLRVKTLLQLSYGDRLKGVVLYGSEARGSAGPDSDIDLLVLLDHVEEYGHDLRVNIDALYDLSLELGRRISAKPVDAQQYETIDCPLYRHVHQEGIAA